MFFYNLSQPVSLSKDGIEISFLKDIFVKQAKEESKNAPLKKAAMEYFGVSDINIHVKLADENTSVSMPKPDLQKLERKPAPAPVNSDISSIEVENAELVKEAFAPENKSVSITSNDIPADFSDQSKMVMELFNGKHVD
jgi:hypothetical protein